MKTLRPVVPPKVTFPLPGVTRSAKVPMVIPPPDAKVRIRAKVRAAFPNTLREVNTEDSTPTP